MNCVELAASSGMGLRIPDLPAGVSHLAGLRGTRYINLPTSLLELGEQSWILTDCPGNEHGRVEGMSALASELAVYSSQAGLFFPLSALQRGEREEVGGIHMNVCLCVPMCVHADARGR